MQLEEHQGVQSVLVAQVGQEFLVVHGAAGLPGRVRLDEILKAEACRRHIRVWGAVRSPEDVACVLGSAAGGEEGWWRLTVGADAQTSSLDEDQSAEPGVVGDG